MPTSQSLLKHLSLPPNTRFIPHGSSSFFSTSKLLVPAADSQPEHALFLKSSRTSHAAELLAAEAASLKAISNAVPEMCPKVVSAGEVDGTAYLLAEFITPERTGSEKDLAGRLARLHKSTSPNGKYGWEGDTFCGETRQEGGWWDTWEDMFSARLRSLAEKSSDGEVKRVVGEVCEKVIPRLLGNVRGDVPALVHGDLWSGNAMGGMVIDPCSSYSSREFEAGIMRMFGGFGRGFWQEYWKECPKLEPVGEYDDRVALYESYHQLNHYVLFGGGYKRGATDIWKTLLKKY